MKRIRISFIIVGFLFSFYLGTKVNMLSADDISMNNRIAIVNNDQTVIYQDKKYNFGEIFSSKANDDKKKHNYSFDVTTKMNADVGISTGTYDAEILIPSNFSAAIVSINDDVPIQAELEYKINENLDSKYYYKVKDDVINMTNSVTSDISFMYIYEILNQLYYTQTHLQTVVDNYNPLATAYEAAKNYDDFAGHTYETLPLNEDEFANIDVSDNEEQMSQIIKDYIQNYSEVVTAYQVYTSDQSNDLKTEIRTENSYMKKLENVLGTIRDTSMSTGRIGEYMKKLGSFDKNLNKYDYVSAEYDPIFEKNICIYYK